MKRFKLLLIFILAFIFISSCKTSSVLESPSTLPVQTNDVNNEIFHLLINIPTSVTPVYAYYDEWATAIEERFNVKIKVNYLSKLDSNQLTTVGRLADMITEYKMSGLIRLTKNELKNIADLRNKGLILPLDEYLDDIEGFHEIPLNVLQPYILDGQLWALPTDNFPFPSVRFIKTDKLRECNLDIPSNLNELYEVCNTVKSADKSNSLVPIMVSSKYPEAYYIKDLFYANGCYVSYFGDSSISFDPTTGAYEDFMLKPEAKMTIEYLHSLLENGYIQKTTMSGMSNFIAHDFLSYYYGYTSDVKSDEHEIDVMWFIKGTNEWYLNPVLNSVRAVVMSSTTKDPQNSIETFMAVFLNNTEGYYMGHFGIEGKSYKIDNNVLTIFSEPRPIEINYYNKKYVTDENLTIKLDNGVELYSGYNEIANQTQQYIEENLLFISPWTALIDNSNNYSEFRNAFSNYFLQYKAISAADFIANYLNEMKKAGIADDLYKLNNESGYIGKYTYE